MSDAALFSSTEFVYDEMSDEEIIGEAIGFGVFGGLSATIGFVFEYWFLQIFLSYEELVW